MVGYRILALAISAVALAACQSSLPVPDYVSVKQPAPYRSAGNGMLLDNEDQLTDAQGYRIDKKGNRVGEVDVQAKMGNETSSAMAGYYVSSTGTYAPGKVMAPSEGARSGAGYGPGSAGVEVTPAGTTVAPTAPPTTAPVTVPATPPASSAPVPLTPSK